MTRIIYLRSLQDSSPLLWIFLRGKQLVEWEEIETNQSIELLSMILNLGKISDITINLLIQITREGKVVKLNPTIITSMIETKHSTLWKVQAWVLTPTSECPQNLQNSFETKMGTSLLKKEKKSMSSIDLFELSLKEFKTLKTWFQAPWANETPKSEKTFETT